MNYTKEQLDGQLFIQGNTKYIIEYTDGDNLQFFKPSDPTYKYTDYSTNWINKQINSSSDRVEFIKPNNEQYEIY